MSVLVALVFVLLAVIVLFKSIKLVRQGEVLVIERLGKFNGLAQRGLNIIVPFIDSVRARVDLREQVVDFPPSPVITRDNVGINIDFVVYYTVTDPARYTYEIANPLSAIANLTATTLRNIIGELELDETLTSRDLINTKLRAVLDEATDRWGIRVNRVELKNIDPPADIRDAMERQLRAERERRESILKAEGDKKAAILRAEGEKESAILRAEAEKEAAIRAAQGAAEARRLEAQAEADAILMVARAKAQGEQLINEALKASAPTREVVALRALETTAKLADGQATKLVLPSDLAGLGALAQVVKESTNP